MLRTQIRKWNSLLGHQLPGALDTKEAIQWLIFARIALLYAVLMVIVLQQVFGDLSGSRHLLLGYGLLAICFGFSLFHSALLEKLPGSWWVVAINIVFDSLIISAWILFSKGNEGLYSLFYLVQILIISLFFYQKGALFTAGVCGLFFALVVLVNPAATDHGLLTWGVYFVLFLLIGFLGGYLSEELSHTTERLRENQKKMEKLTELHELILANMPTGLLTVDEALSIGFVNPAGEHLLGKSISALEGQPLKNVAPELLPFLTPVPEEPVASEGEEAEEAVSATGEVGHRSYFVRGKSGGKRLQQTVTIGDEQSGRILRGDVAALSSETGKLLGDHRGAGKVLLFQDVTQLLRLEEKLKQNEKLAAVGQLAAGIAHEIRNPLASMSASIEMLQGSAVSSAEDKKLMEIAIREIDRLNQLVSEFLDFVKPVKIRFESVDLSALIEELVEAAKRHRNYQSGLAFEAILDSKAKAHASESKLKQVVWNLLINAMQAIEGTGKIEVGCSLEKEGRVMFWVKDNGKGMSEKVLAHLYEPFFTTKDKGTGLGLATAYKIIEAHQGQIRVSSREGEGTKFEIILESA